MTNTNITLEVPNTRYVLTSTKDILKRPVVRIILK